MPKKTWIEILRDLFFVFGKLISVGKKNKFDYISQGSSVGAFNFLALDIVTVSGTLVGIIIGSIKNRINPFKTIRKRTNNICNCSQVSGVRFQGECSDN